MRLELAPADPPPPRERHFTVRFDSNLIRNVDEVRRDLETGKEQVVDARPAAMVVGYGAPPAHRFEEALAVVVEAIRVAVGALPAAPRSDAARTSPRGPARVRERSPDYAAHVVRGIRPLRKASGDPYSGGGDP